MTPGCRLQHLSFFSVCSGLFWIISLTEWYASQKADKEGEVVRRLRSGLYTFVVPSDNTRDKMISQWGNVLKLYFFHYNAELHCSSAQHVIRLSSTSLAQLLKETFMGSEASNHRGLQSSPHLDQGSPVTQIKTTLTHFLKLLNHIA